MRLMGEAAERLAGEAKEKGAKGKTEKNGKKVEKKERRGLLADWQLKGSLSGAFSGPHTYCSCFPCYCCDCVINNMCLVLPMKFI